MKLNINMLYVLLLVILKHDRFLFPGQTLLIRTENNDDNEQQRWDHDLQDGLEIVTSLQEEVLPQDDGELAKGHLQTSIKLMKVKDDEKNEASNFKGRIAKLWLSNNLF